jgi:hypothetical protein
MAETKQNDTLAKNKEAHDKILAAHKEMEKWKPTPTQEENDLAALGQMKMEKEPDGSPVQETKALEAKPSGGGYQTRQAHASSSRHASS